MKLFIHGENDLLRVKSIVADIPCDACIASAYLPLACLSEDDCGALALAMGFEIFLFPPVFTSSIN